MKTESKKRAKELLVKATAVLCIGAAYYLFVRLTGWGIPCVFNLITGKLCPGCGITRMFMALARFDLEGAFSSNALILILLLPACAYGAYKAAEYVKKGECRYKTWETVVLMAVLLATIAFAVLRNTEAFGFLAP